MRSLLARTFAPWTLRARTLRGSVAAGIVAVAVPQGDTGASGVPTHGTTARHYGPTAPIRWPVPARELHARRKRNAADDLAAALAWLLDDGLT